MPWRWNSFGEDLPALGQAIDVRFGRGGFSERRPAKGGAADDQLVWDGCVAGWEVCTHWWRPREATNDHRN